jgi:hypothetical protein
MLISPTSLVILLVNNSLISEVGDMIFFDSDIVSDGLKYIIIIYYF